MSKSNTSNPGQPVFGPLPGIAPAAVLPADGTGPAPDKTKVQPVKPDDEAAQLRQYLAEAASINEGLKLQLENARQDAAAYKAAAASEPTTSTGRVSTLLIGIAIAALAALLFWGIPYVANQRQCGPAIAPEVEVERQ